MCSVLQHLLNRSLSPLKGIYELQYAFGGEGGSRTHVRNTFNQRFTTINRLETAALFVRSKIFAVVPNKLYIARWSLNEDQHNNQLDCDHNHI